MRHYIPVRRPRPSRKHNPNALFESLRAVPTVNVPREEIVPLLRLTTRSYRFAGNNEFSDEEDREIMMPFAEWMRMRRAAAQVNLA